MAAEMAGLDRRDPRQAAGRHHDQSNRVTQQDNESPDRIDHRAASFGGCRGLAAAKVAKRHSTLNFGSYL
jgi:hypothetical protein